MAGKTKKELEIELKNCRTNRTIEALSLIIRDFFKFGTMCFFAYMGFLSVEALADKSTEANIVLDVLGGDKSSSMISYLVGLIGVGYGWRQRKLRHDKVESITQQLTTSQLLIDEKRTSSDLTPRGETRPEDKS